MSDNADRSELSLDILRELDAEGWRLWNLHQHSRGHWECRMYNNRTPARGAGSGFLSPDGSGSTPYAAILAAMGRVDDTTALATVRNETLIALERSLLELAAALDRRRR